MISNIVLKFFKKQKKLIKINYIFVNIKIIKDFTQINKYIDIKNNSPLT